MMNFNLLLVFVALFNAATGQDVEISLSVAAAVAPPVQLGTASNYAILAKDGISTVTDCNIFGDVAANNTRAAITGFSLSLDPGGQWSTSSQINGKAYAINDAAPTSSELTTAVSDMETAYNDAAGRPNRIRARTNLGAVDGVISGEILTPGVYTFDVNIIFSTDITFQGGENDVFIMQTTQNLVQAAGTKVTLLGGAKAKNIFWQVAGTASVGATSTLQGILLVKKDVLLATGSYLNGRVLSQTACDLQEAMITEAS
jgi:hypothetical protein